MCSPCFSVRLTDVAVAGCISVSMHSTFSCVNKGSRRCFLSRDACVQISAGLTKALSLLQQRSILPTAAAHNADTAAFFLFTIVNYVLWRPSCLRAHTHWNVRRV
ncbi:hypothetical protein GQ54DRAFT_125314 [Martensiomyces pterosporus]|nr:hypothetical protein GQ54DRAFT_125314 [Martensiomyces pterosporus]